MNSMKHPPRRVFALAALILIASWSAIFSTVALADDVVAGREAVVIGISKYADAQLAGSDKAPENDTKLMEEALKKRGFNVTVLKDSQATRAGILRALQNTPPGTNQFVVYYAGQSEADQGRSFIYPYDSVSTSAATWLSAEDLRAAMEGVAVASRTIILDTKAAGTLMTAPALKNWVCYCAACKAGQDAAVAQYGGDPPKKPGPPGTVPPITDFFHKVKKPEAQGTFTHYFAAALKDGNQGQTWQQLLDGVATGMQAEIGTAQAPDLTSDFVSQRVFLTSPLLANRSPVAATAPPTTATQTDPTPPTPVTPAKADNSQANAKLVALWTGADGGVDISKAKAMSAADVTAALKAGADSNTQDTSGVTLLLVAAGVNRPDVAKLAIDAHADVNYKNPGLGSALVFAAQSGSADVVKVLLVSSPDLTLTDMNGLTALAAAKAPNDGKSQATVTKIIALLKAAGETK